LKKVLFLDIDGVLFLGVSTGAGIHGSDPFDERCVDNLNRITKDTACEIIVTSTWQNEYSLQQLQEIFRENGVTNAPAGVSSVIDGGFVLSTNRGQEILDWLKINDGTNRLKWCAVDDCDLTHFIQNFVKCDPRSGLSDPSISTAVISILNG
jgi:hypothetical protein